LGVLVLKRFIKCERRRVLSSQIKYPENCFFSVNT
jgi:hypothetical protein